MKTALRDYQQELYTKAKKSLLHNRAVIIQLATGGGKTPLMASMCDSVYGKDKTAWIIVNRKELIKQTSDHLRKWNVPHGIIAPNMQESRAFKIHVVSKDTLVRRYDRIKNWPDLLIFDECHLYLDRQIEIISHLPKLSKVIGYTATPERLDGRGLSYSAGGVYDELLTGPSIPGLTRQGYLSELRYFSPPIDGLMNLKTKGIDYDEEQLEELLTRKKIYGELVGHYEKYGKGKPALIFCRSVKSAYQTAERFRDKGFNFHCIEGKMTDKNRKGLIDALTKGEIDGLCNCEIATYGLDIPRVEYAASIRPTLSRALYMQMIGRILRPYEGKECAMFFDHVNMILEHQDENFPGVPLHYVPEITWNFDGTEKRKKNKKDKNIKLCPFLDYMYCENPHCNTCPHNPHKSTQDARKPMIVIDAALKEIKRPVPFQEKPAPEKIKIRNEISDCILDYKKNINTNNAVSKMLKIAEDCGYAPLWVYWQLNNPDKRAVNIMLLHEIARQKGYKPGWCTYKIKEIKEKIENDKNFDKVMNA